MPTSELTHEVLRSFLGPVTPPAPLAPRVEDEVVCDGYLRRLVSYDVPDGRASAFLGIPQDLSATAPVIFCHHQHAQQFGLGKSEVFGLRGAPDQAYAAELASKGFVTIAPDAVGFEDRNWATDRNVTWFELSRRLVLGRTLLATCLQEISLALDYATQLPEADPERIGFIGHSYGGRAAIWAPAWDPRITASVSNCGATPYRASFDQDLGLQAEFVVPGFASEHDIEDVIAMANQCRFLIRANADDRWSRGVDDLGRRLKARAADHATVELWPGGHEFTERSRQDAYRFLAEVLCDVDKAEGER